MGQDFLDRQSLWYMFYCNSICLCLFDRISCYSANEIDIRQTKGYPVQPYQFYMTFLQNLVKKFKITNKYSEY